MTRSDVKRGRGYAMSNGLLLIAAPIIAYGGSLATGSGWSPLVYIAFGPVIAIAVGATLRRRMRDALVGQFAMLVLLACGSAAVGYATANPRPAKPFALIFKTPPPPGVSDLHARVQWFDGQTILVRFHADEATISALVKSGGFQPDDSLDAIDPPDRSRRVDSVFNVSTIAEPDWRKTIGFQAARLFRSSPDRAARHSIDDCRLLVNERGDAWAMYNWSG